MKSIRLSLVVYFLALLGAALGAVSLLVYRTTQQTLMVRKKHTQELLQAQYEESCRKEKARLEDALLSQARALAGMVQYQWRDGRWFWYHFTVNDLYRHGYPELAPLAFLTAAPVSAQAHLALPLTLALAADRPFGLNLERPDLITVRLDEDDLAQHLDARVATYFRIDNSLGGTYSSRSLAGHALPYDPGRLLTSELMLDWRFDTVPLAPDKEVLRVVLKVSPPQRISRPAPPPPPPSPGSPPPGGPRGGWRPPGPPIRPGRLPPSATFTQCACDIERLNASLTVFQEERDDKLAKLDAEVDESLRSLRKHLLAIGLLTFGATVVGGLGLVWLGLRPLEKLSEAVSRVSVKDFRLPLSGRGLPAELRPIVARLTETLDLLKRAFAREKQAAADISHELRTPLAALLTTTELALRKPRSAEEYRELLEECRASGRQMSQLVERLLTLARLDAGVDVMRPRPVDAADLAEQCATLVRPLAEAQGLQLKVRPGGPAVLTADPDKLREVVTNLLHNAIQYNRPGGSVELAVRRDNGELEVVVHDTGIGIGPEAREHIFERFYRADPSRQADGLHAGLGLAIVKGYVDLMGGRIAVESAPGEGSTFRVHLPA